MLAPVAVAADPYGALPPQGARTKMFEFRLGAYVHDPVSPESGSVDINGEFLIDPFVRHRGAAWGAIAPRIHFGGTAATRRGTSQGYAGLTWTFDITPKIFIEAGFGGAYHNGKTGLAPVPGFNAMGCGWGFHEQGSIGYRITDSWSVMATVEHTSNSGICTHNRGLTNVGLRIGYSF